MLLGARFHSFRGQFSLAKRKFPCDGRVLSAIKPARQLRRLRFFFQGRVAFWPRFSSLSTCAKAPLHHSHSSPPEKKCSLVSQFRFYFRRCRVTSPSSHSLPFFISFSECTCRRAFTFSRNFFSPTGEKVFTFVPVYLGQVTLTWRPHGYHHILRYLIVGIR